MKKMKWTEVPAGVVNAAIQRFLVVLGDDAGTVVNRINHDDIFTQDLVSFATDWTPAYRDHKNFVNIKAATARLWETIGKKSELVADRINKDPRFVSELAMFAVTLASDKRPSGKVRSGSIMDPESYMGLNDWYFDNFK